jgi:hypothetical protein
VRHQADIFDFRVYWLFDFTRFTVFLVFIDVYPSAFVGSRRVRTKAFAGCTAISA